MSWQIAIIIGFTTMGVATILQRRLLKKVSVDSIAFSGIFQIIIGLIAIVIALFNGANWSVLTDVWYLFIIASFFYMIAAIARYIGLKTEHAAVYSIGLQSRVFWSFLFSILILHETNTPREIIGAILIVIAVAVLAFRKNKLKFDKSLLFILLSALAGAIGFIADIYILAKGVDIYLFAGLIFIIPGLMNLAIFPNKIGQAVALTHSMDAGLFYSGTILYGLSAMMFYLAFILGGTSSAVTALFQLYIPLVVILGIFILKEKENIKLVLIAGILSIIGAILVG